MAGGRALAGVVVAHRHQHAAVARGAGEVGVAEHVARAVHARPLAVPEAEDAVDLLARIGFDLLGAQHGGGGEVLVDGGQELDLVLGDQLRHAGQFLVHAAQR